MLYLIYFGVKYVFFFFVTLTHFFQNMQPSGVWKKWICEHLNIFCFSERWCAQWLMCTDRFGFIFVSKGTQREWASAYAQASASHLARCLEPDHLKCDTRFLRALRRPRLISAKPHGSLKVARLIAFNMNCIWFRHTSGFTFPLKFTTAVNWYNC